MRGRVFVNVLAFVVLFCLGCAAARDVGSAAGYVLLPFVGVLQGLILFDSGREYERQQHERWGGWR